MELETIKLLKEAGFSVSDILSAMPQTVPVTAPQTVPDTVPQTVPDTVPQTVPATVPQTVPATVPQTVPANDVSNRDILAELSKLTNMIAVSNIQNTMTATPPVTQTVDDVIQNMVFGAPPKK